MNELKTIITIDVENPQTPMIQGKVIDNRIWSNGWGIEKIIAELDRFNVKGDFFVNVYEYKIWGQAEINKILRLIFDKGHFVHLHTHPYWIDEKRRENMFQFSAAEQRNIIKLGKELICKAIPVKEMAHRAGAYGFNQSTLDACIDNGILIDSSNYYGHKFCKFILTENEITAYKNLTEVPVTFSFYNNRYMKTDLDWVDANFLKDVYLNEGNNLINLFMHSYSLSKTKDYHSTYYPDEDKVLKLRTMLEYLIKLEGNSFKSILKLK